MFERIDRVAIAVKNLDKAKGFFSDLLDITFDPPGQSEELGMRGAYSSFGLELIEATHPDSVIGRFLKQRGEGVWAVVLKVRDMDEAVRKFEQKGLRVAGDIQAGKMREVAFHPRDTYGVEIVLAEYPEMHPATVAANLKGGRQSEKEKEEEGRP